MQDLRNVYENKLLMCYSKPTLDELEVSSIINEYTQARLNDSLTNPSFAVGANGPHGDIYMRLLRESIMDELKLTDSIKYSDLEV